jgi:hypothetical protein
VGGGCPDLELGEQSRQGRVCDLAHGALQMGAQVHRCSPSQRAREEGVEVELLKEIPAAAGKGDAELKERTLGALARVQLCVRPPRRLAAALSSGRPAVPR